MVVSELLIYVRGRLSDSPQGCTEISVVAALTCSEAALDALKCACAGTAALVYSSQSALMVELADTLL